MFNKNRLTIKGSRVFRLKTGHSFADFLFHLNKIS